MDMDAKDANGYMNKPLVSSDDQKVEDHCNGEESEDASETSSLLQKKRGGISKKSDKARRKVQWNDRNGNKLAEVLEFVPSDVSDSEDDDTDYCICAIM